MPDSKADLTTVTLTQHRHCQWHPTQLAQYDFRTSYGPWAYGCTDCWIEHRHTHRLGTGIGQKIRYEMSPPV